MAHLPFKHRAADLFSLACVAARTVGTGRAAGLILLTVLSPSRKKKTPSISRGIEVFFEMLNWSGCTKGLKFIMFLKAGVFFSDSSLLFSLLPSTCLTDACACWGINQTFCQTRVYTSPLSTYLLGRCPHACELQGK